jgi:hypothetical protein
LTPPARRSPAEPSCSYRVPGLFKLGVESAPPACEFAAAGTDLPVLSPLWLSVEVLGSPCMACLPWLRSTPKNNPPVQCGSPSPQPTHGRIPTRYAVRVITSPSPTSRSSEMNPGRRTR